MTMNFILCGLGAVVGACLRSYLSDSFNTKSATLPWGTILANHIGCFLVWHQEKSFRPSSIRS